MRPPTHPGEILLKEFLWPRKIKQYKLAEKMGVTNQRVNTLIKGKRGITPDTALLLAKILGTTPQFWMHLQVEVDLFRAQQNQRLKNIT